MRRRHVPQRTCIACRQTRAKQELVRLVRTPERELVIDEKGKLNGRGAYLCRQRSCWEAAMSGDQIGRALKMQFGDAEREVLQGFYETL